MKRFLIFMYYLKANGGVEDLIGSSDNLEEIEKIIRDTFCEGVDKDFPEDAEDQYVSLLDIQTGEKILDDDCTGYLISNARDISIIDEETLSAILNKVKIIIEK
ncbi:hypothetical protein [Clostridium beijerinckii]|uniref:hypothetical protein n=1 Tax=Clostridium beijerinckii TaxID=1520 RepID=UPI00156EDE38|nr:hypothetical protein [Clostridium beijerinckii]NRU52482.1 hypothetical protein [Clostridium beijerinckii]NYC69073.1 hypothetical protein [Clostridium beijerinckii]NYC91683.1 hypothetical protein [Clostridium beijerinckii]